MFASLTEWTLLPMVFNKILGCACAQNEIYVCLAASLMKGCYQANIIDFLCGAAALAFDSGLGKSWSVFSYEIIKKHRALGRAGQP